MVEDFILEHALNEAMFEKEMMKQMDTVSV